MPPGWPHHQGVALSWGRIFLPLLFLLVTARSRVDGEDGEATPILLSRATTLLRVRDTIMVLEGCFYGQSPRIELKRRVFVGLFIPKILLWKQYCDSKLTLLTDDSGFRTSFYQMPINLVMSIIFPPLRRLPGARQPCIVASGGKDLIRSLGYGRSSSS